jgi:hypothetical protein
MLNETTLFHGLHSTDLEFTVNLKIVNKRFTKLDFRSFLISIFRYSYHQIVGEFLANFKFKAAIFTAEVERAIALQKH